MHHACMYQGNVYAYIIHVMYMTYNIHTYMYVLVAYHVPR